MAAVVDAEVCEEVDNWVLDWKVEETLDLWLEDVEIGLGIIAVCAR